MRVQRLMGRLASADAADSRAAGKALLAEGDAAVEALLDALRHGPAALRKPAAFLLGRVDPSPRVRAALAAALADDEPKVRKNAAIALGSAGDETSVAPLAAALDRETIAWVRPSLVLALGAIGSDAAARAMADVTPASAPEADALRKARERSTVPTSSIAWRAGVEPMGPVFATTPAGLEEVAVSEAAAAGLPAAVERAGLLRIDAGHPRAVLPALRCVFDVRLLVARGPSIRATLPDDLGDMLAGMIAESPILDYRRLVDAGGAPLAYRLTMEGTRVRRDTVRRALAGVMRALDAQVMANRPSHYAVRLALEETTDASYLWLVPAFEPDGRFSYRVRDVGASINPVVAAGIARLVRAAGDGVVVDPCCGSATLLIERARLDPGVRLRGIDISPTAVEAARANVAAARLEDRIRIERGDAADPASWSACAEVVSNLPFGMRTARQDRDLPHLYRRLIANLARSLRAGGRGALFTTQAELMSEALEREGTRLTPIERRTIHAGGVPVQLWLLGAALVQ